MQTVEIVKIVGIVLVFGLMGMMSLEYESFAQTGNDAQTITAELHVIDDTSLEDQKIYAIDNVESNATGLEGMEYDVVSLSSYVSLTEYSVASHFSVKVPVTGNSGQSCVEEIVVLISVDDIDDKGNGNKIYYGTIYYGAPEFDKGSIGDYEIKKGILEQISNDKAIMTFILEK